MATKKPAKSYKYYLCGDTQCRGDTWNHYAITSSKEIATYITMYINDGDGEIDFDEWFEKTYDNCKKDTSAFVDCMTAVQSLDTNELKTILRRLRAGKPFGAFGEETVFGAARTKAGAMLEFMKLNSDDGEGGWDD